MGRIAKAQARGFQWDLFKVFQQLKGELRHWHLKSVAHESGVGESTLYNWLEGRTMYPRLDTISRVADTIGFALELKRVKKKNHLRAVK